MKNIKKATKYPDVPGAMVMNDALMEPPVEERAMVRTQIYLSRQEHEFIQAEAGRRGEAMAAVIRSFIDEKMEIPEAAWTNNPMLLPPVKDPTWVGRKDGAINHDHYIYGGPKKWTRRNGKWEETPPVPEDYYRNPESRRKYDEEMDQWT